MTINETDSRPQAEANISTGPGELLRQAREAKGWTQLEVARRLNLRLAVIESIDNDHYKAGVALTFLRGYVKAYAKVVGVAQAQALAAFDSMSHEQFKAGEPMKSFSKKTRQQASDKWLKRISWLVFLGLLSSLVYWWWHDGASQQNRRADAEVRANASGADLQPPKSDAQESLLPAAAETGPVAIVPLDATSSADANSADANNTEAATADANRAGVTTAEGASTQTASADANVAEAASVDANSSAAPEVAEPSAPPASSAENAPAAASATDARILSLNFSDDCWIKITDSKGKVLSEGVKKAQQSLVLEGEPPFKLILGVPSVVRAEYLGKAVDLSAFSAGRAARLTVPQS